MKKLWARIGIVVYWVTWPGLYIVLIRSKRTRVALLNGSKLLVVKSWLGNGKWGLPGGGVHKNELPKNALIREVTEETGLTLNRQLCKPLARAVYKQDGLRFKYNLYVYRIKPRQVPLTTNREVVEAAWVHINDLSVRNANSDVITALKEL